MESRFAHDFSQVRIYTNARAAESVRAVNAKAYTLGKDVVFGAGRYVPGTSEGQRLLAHELTHVVQQEGHKNLKSARNQTGRFVQRSPGNREDFQTTYKITIEKGDKEWTKSDLEDLKWALSKLTKEEAKALEGYKFLRWTTKEARAKVDKTYKDPGKDECGIHEPEYAKKTYKISLYDGCFGSAEAKTQTMAGVRIGRFNILHEIGHAMEIAELRRAWEEYDKADNAYNKALDEYNKASGPEQKKMEAEITKLDDASKGKFQR